LSAKSVKIKQTKLLNRHQATRNFDNLFQLQYR